MAKQKKSPKKAILKSLKPSTYKIYGIFDFQEKRLVYVHLDVEQVELEFDLEDYDGDRFDVVSFEVCLL
jgi:hypothetical protein